jgi:iron complex transport system ATP-binding protein
MNDTDSQPQNHCANAFQTKSLCVGWGQGRDQTMVLRDITLSLQQSRWINIVGPNGAGKSTLLKTLVGLMAHDGQVQLLGRPLQDWSSRERARQLSWLGQNELSGDDLRVWDVVMLGRMPHQTWLAPASEVDFLAVEKSLKSTQAWAWRERALGQLSGGERQRVLLARALAVEAQILLMDEPLANLDPPHQVDWLNLIRELVKQGKTVVSVLHEISMSLNADELVIMADGQVIHHGQCNDAATHRALEKVFDNRIKVRSLEGQWVVLAQIDP